MMCLEGLFLAEGFETSLAALSIGLRPIWSVGSASTMAKFPLLSGIEYLTVIADHDEDRRRREGRARSRITLARRGARNSDFAPRSRRRLDKRGCGARQMKPSPEQVLEQIGVREAPPARRTREKQPPNGAEPTPRPKLEPVFTFKLSGKPVPVREWLVRGWIPRRTVTLIQGDGGLGKTSLFQQLQTSCAIGAPWIGLHVEQCVSIGVYTEDEQRDLEIRQAAINAAYGCDYTQTSGMIWFPRASLDATDSRRFTGWTKQGRRP